MSDGGLSENDKKKIGEALTVALAGVSVTGISVLISSGITKLLASNIHTHQVQGNKVIAATNDETTLSSKETSASRTESSMASDEVAAQKGAVKASETDAAAAASDATASEAGAVASRTKAGASDIETKALKMT